MSAFPKGADPAVAFIEILGVATANDLRGKGDRFGTVRRQKKMNMICHLAPGMYCHAVTLCALLSKFKVKLIIPGFNETGFAVAATLNNMIGKTRKVAPCLSGHSISFAMSLVNSRKIVIDRGVLIKKYSLRPL